MTVTTTSSSPLLFRGTLLNQYDNAIEGAMIQLWQTDLDGNYLHPHPGAATSPKSPEHSSIINDFQYFGTDATDINGNFEFLTYRPGIYPNRPFSHFHFMVWLDYDAGDGGDGNGDNGDNGGGGGDDNGGNASPALVTQFYFRDESPPFADVLQLDVTEVNNSNMYKYGSYVNGTIIVATDDANRDPSLDYGVSGGGGGTTTTLLAASPSQPQGPFYPRIDFFSMDNDLTSSDDDDDTTTTTATTPPTATIMQSANAPDTQSPSFRPTIVIQPEYDDVTLPTTWTSPTMQPVQIALPTDVSETSTQSPTPAATPAIQNDNDVTLLKSTSPTMQPEQKTSSSSAPDLYFHFLGCTVFWWMALYGVIRNFIL